MPALAFRTWFGCCSLVLTAAACSSDNAGAPAEGRGGTSSMSSAGTGTTGGKGTTPKPGPVSMAGEGGGTTATGGSSILSTAGADSLSDAGQGNGSVAQVVGKQGGVVMQEGVKLDIPANALTTNVAISVMSTAKISSSFPQPEPVSSSTRIGSTGSVARAVWAAPSTATPSPMRASP